MCTLFESLSGESSCYCKLYVYIHQIHPRGEFIDPNTTMVT